MKPQRSAFSKKEWQIIQSCPNPKSVQSFLRRLKYNKEEEGDSQSSFREVVKRGSSHCLEAALTAAVILEQHGYPPLLVSFESVDELDHVIYVFQKKGLWGSIARSRDAGLHGRKPVYRSIRDLVLSYVDPYVDFTGRITGYALVNLEELGNYDWRFSRRNLWRLERFLISYPHKRLQTSDQRYKKLLARYKRFRSRYPKKQLTDFKSKKYWL